MEIKPVNPKSVLNTHWKDWCWSWNSSTLAIWCEERLIGKDPDAAKDCRQEKQGMTEDEMIGWHHQLDEFEQALGDGEGQGSPICCSPWGHKELDMTEWLNNNKIIYFLYRKYIHRIWCALTNIYGYVTLTMEMKNIFITQITVSLCKSVFSRLQSLVTNYLISAFVSLPLSEYHTNRITQYNFLWFAPFT